MGRGGVFFAPGAFHFKEMCICAYLHYGTWFGIFKPFVPNAPFLYPLKTENRKVLWYFQGFEKRCIGNEWVNLVLILWSNFLTEIFWNITVKIWNFWACQNCDYSLINTIPKQTNMVSCWNLHWGHTDAFLEILMFKLPTLSVNLRKIYEVEGCT